MGRWSVSDLKLFRVASSGVEELPSHSVEVEKSLQTAVEKHLEGLVAVRLLGSEYSTGPTHGGRIDTLGIDENGSPVIIEYKRNRNQNVINQGLYYLDWLLDHQGEFELLVTKAYGQKPPSRSTGAVPASCASRATSRNTTSTLSSRSTATSSSCDIGVTKKATCSCSS